MRMYLSQSTCVEVDWSGIKLSSIPFHSNTYGLKLIHMHQTMSKYITATPAVLVLCSAWMRCTHVHMVVLENLCPVCEQAFLAVWVSLLSGVCLVYVSPNKPKFGMAKV